MEDKTIRQGWECPKCGAVMSPSRDVCINCTGKHKAATYTTLINNFDDLDVTGATGTTQANTENKYNVT